MRVVHMDTHGRKRDDYPIFRGEVETQAVVGEGVSRELRLTDVRRQAAGVGGDGQGGHASASSALMRFQSRALGVVVIRIACMQ